MKLSLRMIELIIANLKEQKKKKTKTQTHTRHTAKYNIIEIDKQLVNIILKIKYDSKYQYQIKFTK